MNQLAEALRDGTLPSPGGFLAITACKFPQTCYTCSTVSSTLPSLIWILESYVKMLESHDPTNQSASCSSCGINRFPFSGAGVKAVITHGGWSKCAILIQEALLVLPVAKLTLNQLPFSWELQLIILQVKLSDRNGRCPPPLYFSGEDQNSSGQTDGAFSSSSTFVSTVYSSIIKTKTIIPPNLAVASSVTHRRMPRKKIKILPQLLELKASV